MRLLLFCLLVVSQMVFAQRIIIKGQVQGPDGKPLSSATVILLNPADSSLVNFGASNNTGNFELKNVKSAEYLLKITFVGNKTFSKRISPSPDQTLVDIGIAKMEEASTELDEVVVAAEKAPVQIKGDTIEFNATVFKTKQNDNVEELLKKLPGVEVENDGSIKAQGEQVQRVTVDGREFFGRDPKLATRNLPAAAVDKVQVFDKKSDQAEFTGIDDGQREKTINLELKEEKRNGVFGSVMGGVGTDDRFNGKVSLNRFKKGQQLSFIGMGNNINEQGFSIDDYLNFSGGLNSSGGGGIRITIGGDNQGGGSGIPLNMGGRQNGIMTNYAAGLNFSDVYNKKTELTSSYFFNYIDHELDKTTDRISYFPNRPDLYYKENSTQQNTNVSHKANLILDHKIDSVNSIRLTSNVTFSGTDVDSQMEGVNSFEDGTLQNESAIRSFNSGDVFSLNNNLLYRHRFKVKGRTLSSNLLYNISETSNNGFLYQELTYYQPVLKDSVINQRNAQHTLVQNYGINFSYTEPLGGRKYLETNYSIRANDSDVERDVYDIEDFDEVYNDLLSNRYTSQYLFQRAGANLKFNHKFYSLTVGASYQFTDLSGNLEISDVAIQKNFNNLLPAVYFDYNFTSTKRLNFNYETSVQEPTVQQLSPVVDNSNALNVYIGNPNLGTAYNHRWNLHYSAFNPGSFISFFARLNATYSTDAIVNSQTIDENFITYTIPVNVGNTFNTSGNVSFGFPINKLNSRINLNSNVRLNNGLSLLNSQENTIKQQTVGGSIRYEYRFKEVFDMSLRANLSNQDTKYEDESRNQSFLNQTYTAEGSINFLKNYSINSTFDYLVYANQAGGETQKLPLLNISFSRFLLKARSGELKVAVVNLLDRNLGVNQSANINYVEREIMNSLGRYFMVSFTYALNKQLNPFSTMRGRGGPRMMMIRE